MTNDQLRSFQRRFTLPFCGVRIECLDREQQPIKLASGFMRKEGEEYFLYTAWHVVTGFDPHHLEIGFELPNRRFLRCSLQSVDSSHPGIERIGDSQSMVLPLYADPQAVCGPLKPLWFQNDQHVPERYLNAVGLFVPFWHDVVKLKLPDELKVSQMQVVNDPPMPSDNTMIAPGEKCLIVGYPYGFSAAIGVQQPTPVVFTRFVASAHIAGERRFELFLDGYGGPAMSGGPVFLDRGEGLYQFGMYTGDIYPDHAKHGSEKTTALGTVADMRLILLGHLPLVQSPATPLNRDGSSATSAD